MSVDSSGDSPPRLPPTEATLAAPRPAGPHSEATLAPPAERAGTTSPGGPGVPLAVPGYEVQGELGRGGMGVVYKAKQVGLNRLCALKMILAGSCAGGGELARFRSEAEAIARLQHPNIVAVYEVGQYEGKPYIALEYCPGGSLDQKLAGTPLEPREAAQLVQVLAQAMQAAHEAGVVHRDLKPANVLLSAACGLAVASEEGTAKPQAARPVPKITDFGLAKRLDAAGQTHTGAVLGTPSYMAPEQAEGKKDVGPAADVYALGAILYEGLTGRPPFRAATALDTILQVVADEPVPPTRLQRQTPVDLETICLKCLHKAPVARYASAQALADDLGRWLRGEPILARPVGALERGWKWLRRHPTGAGLGVASVVAALALVAFFVSWSYQGRLAESNLRLEEALDEAQRARRGEEEQKQLTEQALQRVERFRYFNLIALAGRELAGDDLGRADELLEECPEALRGWEWFYLHGRAHVPRKNLTRSDQVLCLAYSSDGERLASGSRDGSVRIRDENLWHEKSVVIPAHQGPVRAVALSPDGLHLASGGDDRLVRIFELTNKKDVFRPGERAGKRFEERFTLRHHLRPVRAAVYSPDGRVLASADEGGAVWLWDTAAGKPRRLGGHEGGVRGLSFSRDGRRLASGGADRRVQVWDVAGGKVLFALGPLAGHVAALAWGPGDRQLAAGLDEPGQVGVIHVWRAPPGDDPRLLPGHPGGVLGLAFDDATGRLASSGRDGTVRLRGLAGGAAPLVLRGHRGAVTGLAVRPDGRFLASGGGEPGRGGEIKVWDLAPSPGPRRLDGHKGPATAVAFNLDGTRLASAGQDGLLKVWDLATSRALLTLRGHQGAVTGVAFSPDLRLLASSGHDGTVRLWSAATGDLLHTFTQHTGPVAGLAFRADGKQLVSGGGRGGEVKVWDVATRRVVLSVSGHNGPVSAVAFSPDGKRLASAGVDQMVRIVDANEGKELRVLRGHTAGVAALAFGAGGKLASAGQDRTVRLWDADSGRCLHVLAGHSAAVLSVAFAGAGKRLATAAADGTVKLWDPRTGLEACTLSAHPRGAAAVAPGGERLIASANADGSITVWEANPAAAKINENDPES